MNALELSNIVQSFRDLAELLQQPEIRDVVESGTVRLSNRQSVTLHDLNRMEYALDAVLSGASAELSSRTSEVADTVEAPKSAKVPTIDRGFDDGTD